MTADDQKIKEVFDLFDEDKDGTISISELGTALRGLGLNPTQKELKKMMKEADSNGSGVLDFDEFKEVMKQFNEDPDEREADLREAFKVFDKDGSGSISAEELKVAMQSFGEKLSDKEIADMMREADKNGDGEIDYDEFVIMMSNQM